MAQAGRLVTPKARRSLQKNLLFDEFLQPLQIPAQFSNRGAIILQNGT